MRPRSANQIVFLSNLLVLLVGFFATHVSFGQESGNNNRSDSNVIESVANDVESFTDNERQSNVVVATKDDTLISISRNEFGTPSLWRHIAEFNQIDVDAQLSEGQLLLIPTLTTAPRQFALVVFTHGQATRTENESSIQSPLVRNDKIYPGDTIETGRGGFASISFQNGSVVNLQPDSTFKLIHLGCLDSDKTCFIDIRTPVGDIATDVESRDNQTTFFRVTTPFASAAVRGTQFDFTANQTQLLLGVTEGSVVVQSEGEVVDLNVGFGAKTLANQPPGDPVALLHSPTFTNIPPRVAASDRIGWWQVTNAARYEWTISSDAESAEVIEKLSTSALFTDIENLDAGEYYLRVRALDSDGLKGFANTEKFSVADIVEIGSAPVELSYTRTGRELLIAIQQPDPQVGGYEIQIASTPEFADVVSIDTGPSGQAFFSDMNRQVYLRARALISPREVSAFGPSLQTD